MERRRGEMARAAGGLVGEDGFGEGPKRSVLGGSFLFRRAAGMEMSGCSAPPALQSSGCPQVGGED